ncbi:MAG: hypothetical protein ACHQ2Y_00065 [Candidatus Lutacidiplasmatales archaeon]
MGIGADGWIPTERTHPLFVYQVVGSAPVLVIVLAFLWFKVLIPQYGFEVALAVVIITAVASALIDLYFWMVFRPSAVRVIPSGIVVRRSSGAEFTIPRDSLVLRPRPPGDFGLAGRRNGMSYILSPKQFEAAKAVFPTEETGANSAPLRLQ